MTQRTPSWAYILGLVLFFVGIRVGINLADVDQKVSFLNHRSILTHGWLLPLLLFCLVEKTSHHALRLFAIGFLLGSTIHLCFDLFPRGWYGYSLIKVPFYGYTSTLFSWLWIAGSCILCLYMALLLIQRVFEILLSCIGAATTFALSSAGEHHTLLPLFTLLIASIIALALPSSGSKIFRQMTRS